jgi:hypothetical protein
MLKDPRTRLLGVALDAGLVHTSELGASTFGSRTAVWIMTVRAAHLAAKHRVRVGKIELGLHIKVAVHAALRILPHVDDRASAPASFDVLTTRSVTAFTTEHWGVLAFHQQLGMIRSLEPAGDVFVALGTLL